MKKIVTIIILFFYGISCIYSQSTDQNYIHTRTFMQEDGKCYLDQVQYFDGLGRPNQTVQRGITPNGSDLVSLQEYDAFGRDSESWLPGVVSSNNGAFVAPNTVKERAKASHQNDQNPFSTLVYEASPLNRVIEHYGPGTDWRKTTDKRPIATEYLTNTATNGVLACALFTVDGTGAAIKVKKNNYYGAAQLYVTKITDEDKNMSYEFKDKLGQVVLTRQMVGTAQHDTYYVYDDFGDLCFVLPPLASDGLIPHNGSWDDTNATGVKQYAYIYRYDNRNRCTWKKLPGCEPILYVYDKADRLIFSQDGVQKSKGEWAFNKYDVFGRLAVSGVHKTTESHDALIAKCQNIVIKETPGGYFGYSWTSLPEIPYTGALTINYYDNYDHLLNQGTYFKNKLSYLEKAGYGKRYINTALGAKTPKGLLTATRVRLLQPNGIISGEIATALYYDNRGRLIQSKSTNNIGGVEEEYITYNFVGQPTKRQHIHSATGKTTQTELYTYTYDHAGRLLDTKHKLNTGAETLIASNTYDELGRLKANKKGGNANLNTTYTYNIRSWTTSMKSYHLHFNLDYTHGGNIKNQAWTQVGKTRKYDFSYDNLSRLTAANYTGIGTEKYNASYSYDKHGNMMTIQRGGLVSGITFNTVDNLALSYVGNQLNNVHDTGTKVNLSSSADFKDYSIDAAKTKKEYAYNANGAMTQDLNKGISTIQYNSLNLPTMMDIKSPVGEARNEYTYSAGGQKLKVIQKWNPAFNTNPIIGSAVNVSSLTTSLTTDYVGNKIYENGALKRILIDGGYIEGGKYHYYLTDHLGNNRAVTEASGIVIQQTQYYPFGMAFAERTGGEKQPYKYNNKELDTKHGLNMYDYSARYLDNAVPRFTSVDPLAEKYYSISPYVYVGNNPLRYVDYRGDSISVASSVTEDEGFSTAFNAFANTKKGQKFLANYASKGQTIAGHTFNKDGKYHKKGVNLNYKAGDTGSYRGMSGVEKTTTGAELTVTLSNKAFVDSQDGGLHLASYFGKMISNEAAMSRTITLFHESFMHVDLDTKDFLDDGAFNSSNIDSYYKKSPSIHQHHHQMNAPQFQTPLWPLGASQGIQEANQVLKAGYTPSSLRKMMWSYGGSLGGVYNK